jgi:membrane protease subunit (stomatin/prohibitin family)
MLCRCATLVLGEKMRQVIDNQFKRVGSIIDDVSITGIAIAQTSLMSWLMHH